MNSLASKSEHPHLKLNSFGKYQFRLYFVFDPGDLKGFAI